MKRFWRKKKLVRKILFAIAIPYTKEQFFEVYGKGHSDFIKGLEAKYNCFNEDLWEKYKQTALSIEKAIKKLNKEGVFILDRLTIDQLEMMSNMNATIIVAHHSNISNELELYDKMVTDEDFVEQLPKDYSGWLDLSCCNSDRLQSLIRIHLENPDAHIIAPDKKTAVNFRMDLYLKVIKLLNHNSNFDYFDAFKLIIKEYQNRVSSDQDLSAVEFLGREDAQSSVFAPAEVLRGQSFMVQVYIHKRSASDEIEVVALAHDVDAEHKRSVDLTIKGKNIKLKKGDEIGIAIKIIDNNKDFKNVTPSHKILYWSGSAVSADFVVRVADKCNAESFFGHVRVSINRIPVAETNIKAKVVDVYSENYSNAPSRVSLFEFNKQAEMKKAKKQLLNHLNDQKRILLSNLAMANIQEEREQIEVDIEICNNSIRVLNEDASIFSNTKKVVFVSSTSDLIAFRKAIEEQIKACEMTPEMYEYWPQQDKTPSDVCCAKVLSSDILVCILGANYGFIRPDTGSSMTEMELKCAMQSGKPILIYVLKDYKDKMQLLLPEGKDSVEKQSRLIGFFEKERMIKFITDEISLSTISGRELERVKRTIS